uniref:Uncharacterized protein n=1 Tax=Chromera velia CCMP2878 TaxID=1169474 RepID=A0A0G4HRE1_9ALVE|mmetsp:Transcript_956/g.2053  ORF Transcript_956/g.2053 Transcript_956/m.2053 type:complete len:229 (-) Transcript_956:423-1109(-)|eukprot:Cvel_30614.t1-p1 / transcript=Cvel_30614.t1 / gene=Cvel_30614 / organism=Chromera_velia_CCMP2878 / gene_product=hypothetical protein / transcript_product=hypothetical protein / location=Cvel_scaffold4394:1220-2787(-) / protein_length=228 / sequence_SO=supercontig / SO=protein_coding / is_pseudo=false
MGLFDAVRFLFCRRDPERTPKSTKAAEKDEDKGNSTRLRELVKRNADESDESESSDDSDREEVTDSREYDFTDSHQKDKEEDGDQNVKMDSDEDDHSLDEQKSRDEPKEETKANRGQRPSGLKRGRCDSLEETLDLLASTAATAAELGQRASAMMQQDSEVEGEAVKEQRKRVKRAESAIKTAAEAAASLASFVSDTQRKEKKENGKPTQSGPSPSHRFSVPASVEGV